VGPILTHKHICPQQAIVLNTFTALVYRFPAETVIANNPHAYGFDLVDYDAPLDYEEVEISGNRQLPP
jgi:hypothetical protein